MYSDSEFSYYKVPVSIGTKLVEGTVPITCEKGNIGLIHIRSHGLTNKIWFSDFVNYLVGMKAVCTGQKGCSYDSASCVVTPLSSDCGNPMSVTVISIMNNNLDFNYLKP